MAKTILLADDSVTIQKVVELTFMDEDYEVVAVSDGQTALQRLPEVAPDLVIADIHMPGADGYEVCRQCKASHPTIPVLLLVGTFEHFDEAKFTEVGADGHLKKPFDSQDLLGQVESLISGAAGVPAAGVPAAPTFEESPEPTAVGAPEDDSVFALGPPPGIDDLEPPLLDEAETAGAETGPPAAGDAFDLVPEAGERDAVPSSTETAAIRLDASPSVETEAEVEDLAEPAPAELGAPALKAAAEPAAPGAAAERVSERATEVAVSGEGAGPAAETNGSRPLSDDDVDRIARRVAELMGEKTLREVAWEVVPDLAEVIIKERIRELESQVE